MMTAQLFPLGKIVATPGAITALKAAQLHPLKLLIRHAHGDWGISMRLTLTRMSWRSGRGCGSSAPTFSQPAIASGSPRRPIDQSRRS